jgi:hypothetical protein
MTQEERSAVLVVRLWKESGAEGTVRGRITMTANADAPNSTETAVASAEEIVDVVRGWLDEFESA